MNSSQEIPIEKLKTGDREAFASMVDQYSSRLYRVILGIVRDHQEAEDVLQESFIKAYRALDSFESRSALGTWLYRIATNQALMRLRKKTPALVSLESEPADTPKPERPLTDWCCLPEEDFLSSESRRILDQALENLSHTLRITFVLRDMHELTTRETAKILNISEAAVKTRLSRARMELRNHLSRYYNERVKEGGYDET